MIRVVHPGSGFLTHPGVKKAPDPGSGSATLVFTNLGFDGLGHDWTGHFHGVSCGRHFENCLIFRHFF
jgi:hypothetical protein